MLVAIERVIIAKHTCLLQFTQANFFDCHWHRSWCLATAQERSDEVCLSVTQTLNVNTWCFCFEWASVSISAFSLCNRSEKSITRFQWHFLFLLLIGWQLIDATVIYDEVVDCHLIAPKKSVLELFPCLIVKNVTKQVKCDNECSPKW